MEFDPPFFLFHFFAMASSDFDIRILPPTWSTFRRNKDAFKFGVKVLLGYMRQGPSSGGRDKDGNESPKGDTVERSVGLAVR